MPVKLVVSMSAARYVLQKYTKSWGWLPPMPHFLFGGRNILNGGRVVDGCEWHSLLYKVWWCWLDVMAFDGCGWHSLLYKGVVVTGVPSEVRRKGCAFLSFGI